MTAYELKEVIRLHSLWLRNDPEGKRANLTGAKLTWANLTGANLTWADLTRADLTGADLTGANLTGAKLPWAKLTWADLTRANLTGAVGNMYEVKSAQFDRWHLVWTRARDGVTTLRIGCQSHDLEMWRKSDPRWISAMDGNATAWWAQYGAIVLALVDASPAVMWGNPVVVAA
jgi:hypothetical protein